MSIVSRDYFSFGSPCFRCGHYCCQSLKKSCRASMCEGKGPYSWHLNCYDCKQILNLRKDQNCDNVSFCTSVSLSAQSSCLPSSKKTSPGFRSSDRQYHQKFSHSLSEILKPPPVPEPEPLPPTPPPPTPKESGLNFDFNALSLGQNSVTVAQNYLNDPRIGSIWSWKLLNSIEESKNPNPILTSFFLPRKAKLNWTLVFYRQNTVGDSKYQFRLRIFSTTTKDDTPIELDSDIIQLTDNLQFSTFKFENSSTLNPGFYLISIFRIWNSSDLKEDLNPALVVSLSGKEE